jgi:hypothetical protein
MLLMHNIPVDKHSIRLRAKTPKKPRSLVLNHNIAGLCAELVSSQPFKTEMGAERQGATLRHEVAIQKDAHGTEPWAPVKIQLRRFVSYLYGELHKMGFVVVVQRLELSQAGPTDVNRAAELEALPGVGCSDLIGGTVSNMIKKLSEQVPRESLSAEKRRAENLERNMTVTGRLNERDKTRNHLRRQSLLRSNDRKPPEIAEANLSSANRNPGVVGRILNLIVKSRLGKALAHRIEERACSRHGCCVVKSTGRILAARI